MTTFDDQILTIFLGSLGAAYVIFKYIGDYRSDLEDHKFFY
jgi:hypothetical protein